MKKGPLVVDRAYRGWNPTQLCADYVINHEIRIPNKDFMENIRPFFLFLSWWICQIYFRVCFRHVADRFDPRGFYPWENPADMVKFWCFFLFVGWKDINWFKAICLAEPCGTQFAMLCTFDFQPFFRGVWFVSGGFKKSIEVRIPSTCSAPLKQSVISDSRMEKGMQAPAS